MDNQNNNARIIINAVIQPDGNWKPVELLNPNILDQLSVGDIVTARAGEAEKPFKITEIRRFETEKQVNYHLQWVPA